MIKLYPPKLFYCQNPLFTPGENNVMEIKSLFDRAVAESNFILKSPGDEIVLRLYSLYQQATKGDIDLKTPVNTFDFAEKAKYEAWASLKGKSKKDAQTEYIKLVYKLKNQD